MHKEKFCYTVIQECIDKSVILIPSDEKVWKVAIEKYLLTKIEH